MINLNAQNERLVMAIRVARIEMEKGLKPIFYCKNQEFAVKFLQDCFPGALMELQGTDRIKVWGR